jgi:hypothetical protein
MGRTDNRSPCLGRCSFHSRSCRDNLSGNSCWSLFVLEALPAKHRPSLRWLKGDGRFNAAFGAFGAGLGSREASRCRARTCPHSEVCPFELAGFTPLGVILELFVEEEKLFAGSEDELATAVCAG